MRQNALVAQSSTEVRVAAQWRLVLQYLGVPLWQQVPHLLRQRAAARACSSSAVSGVSHASSAKRTHQHLSKS